MAAGDIADAHIAAESDTAGNSSAGSSVAAADVAAGAAAVNNVAESGGHIEEAVTFASTCRSP